MVTASSFHWPPQRVWKTVDEDVSLADEEGGLFIVADGVTRRGSSDKYPDPSPAGLAAEAVVKAISDTLAKPIGSINEDHVRDAFQQANESVWEVNQGLGLWGKHDWWSRDLAGAVASCLVIRDESFLYGFIADCGIAHLSPSGKLLWHTPDMLASAEKYLPSTQELGEKERFIRIRRDFRNRPDADHPTYGVLTGEEPALSYVQINKRKYDKGDILIIYSDGAAPFVLDDPAFRGLLIKGEDSKITDYVTRLSSSAQHFDEKTLIVARAQI